jgi:hypothetical protein
VESPGPPAVRTTTLPCISLAVPTPVLPLFSPVPFPACLRRLLLLTVSGSEASCCGTDAEAGRLYRFLSPPPSWLGLYHLLSARTTLQVVSSPTLLSTSERPTSATWLFRQAITRAGGYGLRRPRRPSRAPAPSSVARRDRATPYPSSDQTRRSTT